jgi:hypothetical protein
LGAPESSYVAVSQRLDSLYLADFLRKVRVFAPRGRRGGAVLVYALGPKAVPVGTRMPRLNFRTVEHTFDIGEALVALTRDGFAAPVTVTGWRGEAELRTWGAEGTVYADAEVDWHVPGGVTGSWSVEVDRGTEARAEWRTKLRRYGLRLLSSPMLILTVTTSDDRASYLAKLATDMEIPMLSTTLAEAKASLDPLVFDSARQARSPLSVATEHFAREQFASDVVDGTWLAADGERGVGEGQVEVRQERCLGVDTGLRL